ncbi:hypothetical protein DVH24_035045 [Malus domestica]|uniref:C2 domain-containing protein n=1 Tax=Malus domestica TaxID=3750 RepID=A0A498IHI1_MALDO|nr:hypothetical protein DVH24_035045 [Malus domestica]
MATRKLIVEVCNAKNLMPKDGQGTASAYAIVDFDGQRRRTKTKQRDLNPEWDEKLEFLVNDSESMATEILEINIYNDKKAAKRNTFLGKVKIPGNTFVKSDAAALVYFPLEKRSVFSQIKGEVGLKIYYIDEDPPAPPPAEEEKKQEAAPDTQPATEEKPPENPKSETAAAKTEEKKEETDNKQEEKPKEEAKPEEKPNPPEKAEEASTAATPPAPPPEVQNPPIAYAVAEKTKQTEKEKNAQVINGGISELELQPLVRDRSRSAYDLVDRMPFLYVRVVKSKRVNTGTTSTESVYAKLAIGTHSIKTKTQIDGKDWDQVFAFDKEGLNSTSLEVSVWAEAEEKKENEPPVKTESCLGTVSFDLQEVPKRVPPDSPLAPQWYTLESEKSAGNDVMLAVWIGTQADEAFQEAWQSDSGGLIPETRAKVYLSPKLWYLRLTVIQTQDLQLASGSEAKPKARNPELYVKAQLGPQLFKTSRTAVGSTSSSSANPTWNEDLVFVAAEPFEPFLFLTVEDVTNGQSVGHAKVHVPSVERRIDDRAQPKSMWFNLVGDEERPYAGRIHLRVCLEGGYHVLDEAAHVTSDVRAAAKQLAKPPIGLLEVVCPHLLLPTIFMYAFFILLVRSRYRQRGPHNMDPRMSYVDAVSPDELDEELDGFPSTRPADIVRIRYDRLRALGGRAQTLLGDVAAQGERLEALFNWRDPRATGIFVVFCLVASLVFYMVPFKAFVLGSGFYYLRHPRFRDDMPSVPVNFFRRLPSLSDQIM